MIRNLVLDDATQSIALHLKHFFLYHLPCCRCVVQLPVTTLASLTHQPVDETIYWPINQTDSQWINMVLAHLSKSNSRTFQGPYEGYIRRTKL